MSGADTPIPGLNSHPPRSVNVTDVLQSNIIQPMENEMGTLRTRRGPRLNYFLPPPTPLPPKGPHRKTPSKPKAKKCSKASTNLPARDDVASGDEAEQDEEPKYTQAEYDAATALVELSRDARTPQDIQSVADVHVGSNISAPQGEARKRKRASRVIEDSDDEPEYHSLRRNTRGFMKDMGIPL